jgi:hypothetical protein
VIDERCMVRAHAQDHAARVHRRTPSPVGPGALVILLPAVPVGPVIVPGLVIRAATMATAYTERRAP